MVVDGPSEGGNSALLDGFARTEICRSVTVRRFRCAPETAHREHHAVRRLFGHQDSERAGRHETLSEVALGMLADSALIVLIEDAQWCDEPSLRMLERLLRGGERLPFFLVLARNSSERGAGDRVLAEIAAQRRCRMLRTETPPGDPARTSSWPASLDRRPPHMRAVATAVAALGSTDAALVGPLCGIPLPTVRASIDALRHDQRPAGWFLTEPARSRLLTRLPAAELTRLRARAARLLNDAGRPIAEVAEHLTALPRLDEPWMLDTLLDAAADAERQGTQAAAVRYLTSVVAAVPDHLESRLALARALVTVDPEAAMTTLDEAASQPADSRSRRTIVVLFALAARAARQTGEAVRLVKDMVGGLAAAHDDGHRVEAESRTLAVAALAALDAHRESSAQTLRSRVGASPDVPTEVSAGAERVVSLALKGHRVEVAASWARSVLQHDARASVPTLLAAACALHLAGDLPSTLRALDAAVADSVTYGCTRTMSRVLATRSFVSRDNGNGAGALSDVRAAALAMGPHHAEPDTTLARIALAVGLYYAEALTAAERVLRSAEQHRFEDSGSEPYLHLIWLARIRFVRGDTETALRYLAECGRCQEEAGIGNPVIAPWWFESALILGELGRAREATAHVERGQELVRRWPTAKARGLALLAEGMAATRPVAVEILRESSRVLATSFSRVEHARAEYFLGRALLRLEDRKGARRHLRQAALLAADSGWRTLGTLARDTLGAAGGRMRRTVPHRANLLTEREREVAELVGHGASNRAVAVALFVSTRTVELHLTNIYRKLAVDSRAELATALRDRAARPAPAGSAWFSGPEAPLVDMTDLGRRHGLAG